MKKGVALLLSGVLAIPSIVLGVENSKIMKLQNVIEEVKSKIEIPNELIEFSYHLEDEMYQLYWKDETGSESMNVRAEEDGDVLYYHHYKNIERATLAKISYEVAKKNARTFLKQVAPEYEGQLVLKEVSAPTKDYVYRLDYQLEKDGIKVFGKKAYVEVHKQTGEVIKFSGLNYDEKATYHSKSSQLTLEEAEARYLEEIGVKLGYQTRYDYEKKDDISFLAYEIDHTASKGISALTGEVLELYHDEDKQVKYENELSVNSSAESSADEGGLTPSEQKAVDESEGLLSANALKKRWQSDFKILEKMTIKSSNLYQTEDMYIREIICERMDEQIEKRIQATLRVNAVTGELLAYEYTPIQQGEKQYPSWTQKEGDAFLKKVAAKSIQQVSFESMNLPEDEGTLQSFYYQRQENGLPVTKEGIYFTYDLSVGEVTSYYKNWSKASFKKPEGVLTPSQIMKKVGLELVYMQVGQNQYELAYNHETSYGLLDAWTGVGMNYYGEEKVEEVQGVYADIKGHPQEEIITKLFHSGIYLNTKVLNPDEAITQQELLTLLVRGLKWGSISEENIYEEAYKLGLLEEQEKKPNQMITKEEGIRYLTWATPYKKVAGLTEIYQYPYKDEEVSENCKGAIAIAYGLGWLEKSDYFKPKDHLTKAEAMVYLYHLLEESGQDI